MTEVEKYHNTTLSRLVRTAADDRQIDFVANVVAFPFNISELLVLASAIGVSRAFRWMMGIRRGRHPSHPKVI